MLCIVLSCAVSCGLCCDVYFGLCYDVSELCCGLCCDVSCGLYCGVSCVGGCVGMWIVGCVVMWVVLWAVLWCELFVGCAVVWVVLWVVLGCGLYCGVVVLKILTAPALNLRVFTLTPWARLHKNCGYDLPTAPRATAPLTNCFLECLNHSFSTCFSLWNTALGVLFTGTSYAIINAGSGCCVCLCCHNLLNAYWMAGILNIVKGKGNKVTIFSERQSSIQEKGSHTGVAGRDIERPKPNPWHWGKGVPQRTQCSQTGLWWPQRERAEQQQRFPKGTAESGFFQDTAASPEATSGPECVLRDLGLWMSLMP